MNIKGIIYTRVSSDEQVKGTSLDFQEELCRNYCRDKGIEVLSVFREEGASAKTADRAEFLRAIEFCRKNKGKATAFVVAKVDRFARNTEDHFYVRKILFDYGVTLHSVSEPIGNNPAGKFIETVLAGTSEFDNAVRRQRSVDGMIAKLNQGIYPWKSPIGYKCGHFKKHGEKKLKPDEPDDRIFPIIQRGLKHYAEGRCSQAELMRLLDEWGLKEIRGKKTTPQLIDNLLGRFAKFYAGVLENPWTNEKVNGLHTPMITTEELYRIQMRRAGKSVGYRRDSFNPLFPLRKTIKCMDCGRSLTGSSPRGNGGTYPYYHCSKPECSSYGKGIRKENLEKEFLTYLTKITPKQKWLKLFEETVLAQWKAEGQSFDLEAQKYQRQLNDLEAKRKRIFEMREDGSYSKEEFQERKEQADNEIAATKISLSEARIEQFDVEGALSYATQFISDLARQWFDLPAQLRPRFQKLVFPEGIPYSRNTKLGTAKLGLIYEQNRLSAGKSSKVVPPEGIEPPSLP
jgi:site-specific DNA recombinase